MATPLPLDPANRQRLAQLSGRLKSWQARLRYVDYRQAERDCERLAVALRLRFSEEEIAGAAFRAIPRGGLIVLGMLSYALGLHATQLAGASSPDALEFLVDDCSLTGVRFRQALEASRSRRVVFLHLYSHPELRRTIVEREPRVVDCLAAHDLRDLAESTFATPGDHEAWRAEWQRRLPRETYWIGQPEPVCFAWTEPDRPFWNRESGQVEDGWTFLPPHLCLKNRYEAAPAAPAEAVTWRAPAGVVYGTFDGKLWLVNVRDEQVVALEGTGADLWRWWACLGNLEAVAAQLAASYQIDPRQASAEAEWFARDLAHSGLLEPAVV